MSLLVSEKDEEGAPIEKIDQRSYHTRCTALKLWWHMYTLLQDWKLTNHR